MTFARLGEEGQPAIPLLLNAVADAADPVALFKLRNAAAYALGCIGAAVEESTEVLSDAVGLLVRVATDAAEAQALRSYCLEALADIGPPALSALSHLKRIHDDVTEDEDLRSFAWAALKSVGASAREHPCGGTMAEHLRGHDRME